jgi:uncharacterized protein involved in exopolysaccharide biosynthesis
MNAKYGESHPQVIEAKANLGESRKRVQAEIAKVAGSLGLSNSINKQRLGELRTSLETQRNKVLQMKAVRDEGAVLQRDIENAQRNYDQILQRLTQTSLESQATQSNAAVLTSAVPPVQPSSPRILLNMLLAIVVGALMALGSALLLELSDRRVRSPEDVVGAVALPIIGVMPKPTAKRLFGRTAKANLMQGRLLSLLSSGDRAASA